MTYNSTGFNTSVGSGNKTRIPVTSSISVAIDVYHPIFSLTQIIQSETTQTGMNGNGASYLAVYSELWESYQPNDTIFVNILTACARAGLVEEGLKIFNYMDNYNVEPNMEQYACMVDLLGRSGKLKEARDFIKKMPLKVGSDVWGALLGACSLFGNVKIAERVAKTIFVLEPENKVWRVALSNIYANAGKWEDVANIRAEMMKSEVL